MKTKIFYFSGTGNSLQVAKDLAAELKDVELLGIPAFLTAKPKVIKAESIGIVFPVYACGLPEIVYRFAKEIKFESKYIFALTTYAGIPGYTLQQLADIFESKKEKLSAGFGFQMPNNYTPLYGASPEGSQRKMFLRAQAKIKKISEIILNKQTAKIEKNNFILNSLVSLLYKVFLKQVNQEDKKYITLDNCTFCGVCAKVCPVNNIEIKKGQFPSWQHRCQQCLACLQWCPAESIQYGKITQGRKRYRHPLIKLTEIIGQKK